MGGTTCTKNIMHICNVLFMITGLSILTVGAIVQMKYHHYANFVGSNIWTFPVIFIIVGSVVTVIGILGCCGICKESSCMILMFALFVIIIFLVEFALGVIFVNHGNFEKMLQDQFNSTMNQYNDRKEYQDAWSLIQSEMDCCGIDKPDDWYPRINTHKLPPSCCKVINLEEASDCTAKHANPVGCITRMKKVIDDNSMMLGIVVLVIFSIQVFTIISACYLRRSFARNHETV